MTKPTLLLLPGLTCDRTLWAGQVELLDAQYQIPDYHALNSLTAMAQSVLRDAPATFALAGHSMGGRVALEVMRMAPQRVTRLALLDTGYLGLPAGEAGEAEIKRRQALVDMGFASGMRAMAEQWVQGMVHPARLHDEPLITSIVDMIARQTPQQHAQQIHALIHRPDATDVLTSLRCPTLVMCGRQDTWSSLAQHEAIAKLVPGSQLEVIEDAGHMAPMERPAAVAQTLRKWLHD